MKKTPFDRLDKRIIRLLKNDGRISIAHLAERLDVTTPTIRSRMKGLIGRGVMRVAGMINSKYAPNLTMAIIGVDTDSQERLEIQLDALTRLEQVHWAAAVTGRFDIIAEVVVTGGVEDLFDFASRVLPTIVKVKHCETFVVMRSSEKWLCMPEGMKSW
ncbi:MAG: Lrp/AsnC family transcriptional regulator [Desulfobacteraceae bacterium]|nr:Lrp/AsnC family transcriptional regulator [Desulfobacteraceae bacterium]